MNPSWTTQDLVQTFKFIQPITIWAGESFTKVKINTYMLMQDKEQPYDYFLYEFKFTNNVTAAFLKANKKIITRSGTSLTVLSYDKLNDAATRWKEKGREENRTSTQILKQKIENNSESAMQALLDFKQQTLDRGWIETK